jgi:hypothetical protein
MGFRLVFPKRRKALIFNASALFKIKEEHCSETWTGIDGTGDVHKKRFLALFLRLRATDLIQNFCSPNPDIRP